MARLCCSTLALATLSAAFVPRAWIAQQRVMHATKLRVTESATAADVGDMLKAAASLRADAVAAEADLASAARTLARRRARELFELFADGDGRIAPRELARALRTVAGARVSEDVAAALVAMHDADGDGALCWEE